MIIPIGVDCGNADFLRKNNLRTLSFPFDWIVTYSGVADIIKNNFFDFFDGNLMNQNEKAYNTQYKALFVHYKFPEDSEKMIRKIHRFKTILQSSEEEIIFIRKGHAYHHHNEQVNAVKNDLIDAEELDIILQEKYPNLRFKIIVILVCGICFDPYLVYSSVSKNIAIYNIATHNVDDNMYIQLCKNILL
jgi:hypothetical protein